jgi:hypothetical protein
MHLWVVAEFAHRLTSPRFPSSTADLLLPLLLGSWPGAPFDPPRFPFHFAHVIVVAAAQGDAYMIVSGHDGVADHAARMLRMATHMLLAVSDMRGFDGKELQVGCGFKRLAVADVGCYTAGKESPSWAHGSRRWSVAADARDSVPGRLGRLVIDVRVRLCAEGGKKPDPVLNCAEAGLAPPEYRGDPGA